MTDRIRTLTVVLDADYRDDDAKPIIDAILRIRGVGTVSGKVVDVGEYTARAAVQTKFRQDILDLWRRLGE